MQCWRPGFSCWVGKILWRRKWQPTPIFLPGKFHGQRRLASYSTWGSKESDMTKWLTHTHIHTQCSISHKKERKMLFAVTWMDLEIIVLSEVNQRKTNTIWYHFIWNIKSNTNEPIYKRGTDFRQKTKSWLPKWRWMEGWEGQMSSKEFDSYKLLYIKYISNTDLLYSAGNYTNILQ